jgi:hypothetical protein
MQAVHALESWSNVPALHGVQVPDWPIPEKVPAGHATQGVEGSLSWSVWPPGQRKVEQAPVRPAGTKLPGPHCAQAVRLSRSASVVPAGHW